LTIYEGLFIALQGIVGIAPIYVAILAIVVSIVRSVKSTLEQQKAPVAQA